MALNNIVSISVLFTLLSWTSASYVEAVAGAYDASQRRQNLQVAMTCGYFNKFLDPATRQWTDDLTSTCLQEKSQILTYCQKKYPGFDVTNIVEVDAEANITAWCSQDNQEECTATVAVVPFRCLVGSFESDALVVPSLCRFRHLHEEGTCQTPQQWKKAARNSCRQSKTKLASTGMLLPCKGQVDMYQGVEFVCCPRSGHKVAPRPEETPLVDIVQPEPKVQPEPTTVEESEDPYLSQDFGRDEPRAFESAKDRLANKQRERVAMVMQQYQEAQKKLDSSAKNYAAKKKEMAKRYEDTIGDLEVETELKEAKLQEVHEGRIESNLDRKINTEEENYWYTLEQEPLKSKKILRSFEKYLKAVQKKRKHLISHYKHLRRADPEKAAKQTDDILSQLEASALRVDGNVDRLQALPDIYAEIEASIANLQDAYSDNEDDTRFIHGVEEEEDGADEDEDMVEVIPVEEVDEDIPEEEEELPTGDVPQQQQLVTSSQSKTTEGTQKDEAAVMKPTTPEETNATQEAADDAEEEGVEYPTEFRTTLNVLEDETETIPEIPVVAVKPIESYTEEEKDIIPNKTFQPFIVAKKAPVKEAHSKTELHVRSKANAFSSVDKTISKKALNSTPALAFALACAVIGVVMGLIVTVLVIKKKTRRPQVNQNFSEVDPNLTVEQRHIVSMQQNGYENPTYKYFEMQ